MSKQFYFKQFILAFIFKMDVSIPLKERPKDPYTWLKANFFQDVDYIIRICCLKQISHAFHTAESLLSMGETSTLHQYVFHV